MSRIGVFIPCNPDTLAPLIADEAQAKCHYTGVRIIRLRDKTKPDESLAYQYAGQVLRDTKRMGISAHHAQQLADRIASALLHFPPRKGGKDG